MQFELTLLKLFCTREIYKRYRPYIHLDGLPIELQVLLQDFGDYYTEFSTTGEIELDKFVIWFNQKQHPDLKVEARKLYTIIFGNLKELEVDLNDEFIASIIRQFQTDEYKQKLLDYLNSPEWSSEGCRKIIEDFNNSILKLEGDDDFESNEPDSFLEGQDRSKGLKWRLHCIQNTLNSLIPGDFGIIAAGKDTGKSAFLVSETVNFAQQLEEGRILWFTTEQTPKKVIQRLWGCALGFDPLAVQKEFFKTKRQEYIEYMHGDVNRIQVYDARNYTTDHIARKIQRHKPKLVIIDMVDHIKLRGANDAQNWLYLEQLYHALRMIARECPILGSSQVDGQTSGVYGPMARPPNKPGDKWVIRYIPFKMLAGSKVGKQGATDFIITIGVDEKVSGTRYIHVATSKSGKKIQSEASFDVNTGLYTDFAFN